MNEIEYIPDSDKINYKKQLEDLEVVCRLNIANSKLKLEDYDLVIHECLKVLKKSENFKAHYRAGVAYYKKSNHAKSLHHLSKAKDLNSTEDAQQLDKYLSECKKFVEVNNEEKNEPKITTTKSNTSTSTEKENIKQEVNKDKEDIKVNNNTNTSTSTKTDGSTSTTKSKIKEVLDNEFKEEAPKKTHTKSRLDDEIIVEEQKSNKREYREGNIIFFTN